MCFIYWNIFKVLARQWDFWPKHIFVRVFDDDKQNYNCHVRRFHNAYTVLPYNHKNIHITAHTHTNTRIHACTQSANRIWRNYFCIAVVNKEIYKILMSIKIGCETFKSDFSIIQKWLIHTAKKQNKRFGYLSYKLCGRNILKMRWPEQYTGLCHSYFVDSSSQWTAHTYTNQSLHQSVHIQCI